MATGTAGLGGARRRRRARALAALALIAAAAPCGGEVRVPVASLLELRQRHVTVQRWDRSCGAAALVTLLRYQHGLDVSEREAALEMVRRYEYVEDPDLLARKQGFSLLDLKRFAERRGLSADGFGGLRFEHLLDMAPLLVPVRFDGYDHFVVFKGVLGDRVALADPAWGNRTLRVEEFLGAWISVDPVGRIGFRVQDAGGDAGASHPLTPRTEDFVLIR